MKKYLIVIETGPGNCSAFSLDIPGCTTTGKTIEQTMANMIEALTAHIELLEEIPEPLGLLYHVQDGFFKECPLITGALVTEVEIESKKE